MLGVGIRDHEGLKTGDEKDRSNLIPLFYSILVRLACIILLPMSCQISLRTCYNMKVKIEVILKRVSSSSIKLETIVTKLSKNHHTLIRDRVSIFDVDRVISKEKINSKFKSYFRETF